MSGLSWVRVTCLVVVAARLVMWEWWLNKESHKLIIAKFSVNPRWTKLMIHSLQHNILHLTPELLGLSYPSIASSKTRKSKSSIFYSKNTSV